MPQCTTVDFDHDYLEAIERDRTGFVDAVIRMIKGGINVSASNKTSHDLAKYGVKVTPTRYEADPPKSHARSA